MLCRKSFYDDVRVVAWRIEERVHFQLISHFLQQMYVSVFSRIAAIQHQEETKNDTVRLADSVSPIPGSLADHCTSENRGCPPRSESK